MATVKVKFRPSTSAHREGTVYYQVIHDRTPRQIYTDYHVYLSEWNNQRGTVTSAPNSGRLAFILGVKERIRVDVERLGRIIRNLEKSRVEYKCDDIVSEYERLIEENTLFVYMGGVIAKLRSNGKVRTSEAYRTTLNSFRKFREGIDIQLDGLTRDLMESYQAWLHGTGVTPNTVSFYLRILRAVYNRAVEDELVEDRHPFRKVYTGIEKTLKRALPLEVIRQIRNLDLSQRPSTAYARDMFMLSFMLRGMSLIDMAFLRRSDLKSGRVTYRRRKTSQLMTIEWTPEMQEIVDRYPAYNSEFLLPIIRNPEAVAIYAYRKAGLTINRELKEIAAEVGLTIPLTMYVARHSWASAARSKGVPVSVISEGMGHDSELTTQIYLSSLDTTVVDRANSMLLKELKR